MSTEIRQDPFEPVCFIVTKDGEWQGDVEQYADGMWVGDVTLGNGPPSEEYKTRAEAVMYVIHGWRYL